MIPPEFFIPYLGSNIFSAGLLIIACKWPRLTRILFVLIFSAAGFFNAFTALTSPEIYLDYGEMAVLDLYRSFINGFFQEHIQTIVLAIAAGQVSIGGLLISSGYPFQIGLVGGIIFLLAITPLGKGSAFPSTLVMAAALLAMQRHFIKGKMTKRTSAPV